MSGVVRRFARAATACIKLRGGRLPAGAVLLIFALACYCVCRSILDGQPVNIVDATISLVLGCALASTFLAAIFDSGKLARGTDNFPSQRL